LGLPHEYARHAPFVIDKKPIAPARELAELYLAIAAFRNVFSVRLGI
jgi:hypothetical protein